MSASATLPLLGSAPLDAPIARREGRRIDRAAFLAHAEALAAGFPSATHAVVLCGDRYRFMVALAALLLDARTALLPPSAAPRVADEIAGEWNAFRIDDARVAAAAPGAARASAIPEVEATREAVVLFTSGSTGRPTPQGKCWAELVGATRLALERFGLAERRHDIVATIPAQHSYGLESSVLYAMLGPACVDAGRPLYPADVRTALAAAVAPRLLVTTPVHLGACVRAELDWPDMALVLSATAPLSRTLARTAEQVLGAPIHEIFGCSEAGAIASRRTADEEAWLPYAGMALRRRGERVAVHGPHLAQPRPLADFVTIAADGRFELRGRRADEIKIAGKRINLAELNRRLLDIDGVEDGCFVIPDEGRRTRLAAIVVAPGVSEETIRNRLAETIDSVFLPRPLVRVPALERNATGKLPREYLLGLIGERARATVTPP